MKTHRYNPLSQTSRLIEYLMVNRGKWIPLWELMKYTGSGNLCNRARDARRRGFCIQNRVTQCEHGVKHSEYRLIVQRNPSTKA